MSKNRTLANIISNDTSKIKSIYTDSDSVLNKTTLGLTVAAGTATYSSVDSLPGSASDGDQALVTSTNRLYIYSGSGWYNIALINNTPYWVTEASSSYNLAIDSTPTVVTILAVDSDGTQPEYIAATDSDFNQIATVTKDSDKGRTFTITPIDSENGTAIAGTGTITFKASDGVNLATTLSTFTIVFGPDWSNTPTESKIVASDAAAGDGFGGYVSLNSDGTYAIAGSPNDDDVETSSGSAYVFTRSGSTWTQQQKLTASDPDFAANFGGGSVAFNPDATYVIVGSIKSGGINNNIGAAYIFTRSGSTWTQQAKLTPSDGQHLDQFGRGTAINSDATYAIVGAPYEDGGAGDPLNNQGAAYIYYRVGSSWSQQARLAPPANASNAYFGYSVSINSDATYAIAGARGRYVSPSNLPGVCAVYTRSGTTWTLQTEITASDAQHQDNFGHSVDLNSDATYIIAGAPNEDTGGSNAGAAYIFSRSGSTWSQQAKLTASDAQADDFFGYSVSINSDGTFAAVGAYLEDGGAGNPISSAGAIYTFKRTGSTWTQVSKITASDASTNGGYFALVASISGDGKYIAASAQYFNSSQGAAYIYEAG